MAKSLCKRLQKKFQSYIILPSLTPQAVFLAITNEEKNIYNLLNHIFLFFLIICLQIKREKHTQYRYFDGKPDRKKENK